MENIQIKKKGDLYCLNDWVENVVHSKDPRSYYGKLKYPKQKIDGKWYVNENSMKEIYDRSTLMHGNGLNGWCGKYGKLKKGGNKKKNVMKQKDVPIVKEKIEKRKPVVYKMDNVVCNKETKTRDDISKYSINKDCELDDINLNENVVSNAVTMVEPETENKLIDVKNNMLKFDGKDVRIITDKTGDIWFKGANIANVLEYKNTRKSLIDHVDKDDKIEYFKLLGIEDENDSLLPSNINKNDKISIYINESGLYSLIMKSKMKKAKEFQRWVTKEVLPSIRKTGQYNIHDSIKTNTVPQLAYDMNDYLNKNAVYLLHMEDNIYKFGVTKNMKERNSALKRMKYKSIHKIYTVNNNNIGQKVEQMIKDYVKQLEIHRHFNIITREVLMPNNKILEKGILTEFFVANAETMTILEKNINDYILIKTNEYNEKQGVDDKDESIRLQIKLAELTKDKNSEDELMALREQKEIYRIKVQMAKINTTNTKDIENTKLRIKENELKLEIKKTKLEMERLKYGGDKHIRDNPEKNILRKTHKNYKCINDNCTKLTYKKNKMCKYCSCKNRVLNSTKNGRPSYSQLQDDLTHMNNDEIGIKYHTTRQNIGNWIKTYKRYNLLS